MGSRLADLCPGPLKQTRGLDRDDGRMLRGAGLGAACARTGCVARRREVRPPGARGGAGPLGLTFLLVFPPQWVAHWVRKQSEVALRSSLPACQPALRAREVMRFKLSHTDILN